MQEQAETFDILRMTRDVQARTRQKRALRLVAGVALVGFGAIRGRPLGVVLTVGGIHLVVQALTGRSLVELVRHTLREGGMLQGSRESKRVDQASLESFPASDPPAYLGGV